MLDGLLGRGFSSKCKSLIKPTKSRIDVLRRKRNATLKFLKKDIADLMSNGLDINAYGRAGGLLDELRLSWNIDFVEKCCDVVLKHLSIMQKQSECPEECREAISSLMSAAAGFSDFPELRDLRHIFHEKYGDSLELFVNQEFVDNLSSKPFSTEKKVKLMEDIASEFSIAWDSKAFEQRMSRPNVQNQHKYYGSLDRNNDEHKSINVKDTISKGNKHDVSSNTRPQHATDGHRFYNSKEDNVSKRSEVVSQSRQEVSNDWHRPHYDSSENLPVNDNRDVLLQGRREVSIRKHETLDVEDASLQTTRSSSSRRRERYDAESMLPDNREKGNLVHVRHGQDLLPHGKPDIAHPAGLQLKSKYEDPYGGNNSAEKYSKADLMRKDREDMAKPKSQFNNALPPPYVKPNVKVKDRKDGASVHSRTTSEGNVTPEDTPARHIPYAGSSRCERVEVGSKHSGNDREVTEPVKVDSHGLEKDPSYLDGDIGNPLPRPRSIRRHSKLSSNHDDVDSAKEMGIVKRKPRSRRRENSRRGLQVLVNDEHYQNDEEERIIDKLLMHYSKKPSSSEQGKMRSKSKSHHVHHVGPHEGEEFPRNGNINGSDDISETVPPPGRSISLPHEQTGPSEVTKVFARAASFQPDRSNAARHVHPKLPDYDDLAARFAALRGR